MTTKELKSYIDRTLGNSVRCLLPSYWWKRLFELTLDKVDEVNNKIFVKGELPTVNSVSELNNLKLAKGSVASVIGGGMKFSQCYRVTQGDDRNPETLFSKLTRVKNIEFIRDAQLEEGEGAIAALIDSSLDYSNTYAGLQVAKVDGRLAFLLMYKIDGEEGLIYSNESKLNSFLQERDWRFLEVPMDDDVNKGLEILDKTFNINVTSDVYTKGVTWERLAKEGEVTTGEGAVSDSLPVYFPGAQGMSLTDEQKAANAKVYAASMSEDLPPIIFYLVVNGTEPTPKVCIPIYNYYKNTNSDRIKYLNIITGDWDNCSPFTKLHFRIHSDGTIEFVEYMMADSELSSTSTEPIQNKVVSKAIEELRASIGSGGDVDTSNYATKEELATKQDTISDLSTIRSNAEKGASAVQPSSLAKVATSGSYNDLSNKPTIPSAVTESTVSGWGFTKNTGTVTGVKVNGSTKSPSSGTVDIGNVVTSVKINGLSKSPSSGVVDLGTVITDISGKQDKITDLETIRSGAAKGATAIQEVKTINGESIVGSGNIEIKAGTDIDVSTLATKTDLENLTNEVIDNEEVLSAALNDINDKVIILKSRVDNEAATKEELYSIASSINQTILSNEEIIAAALNDINLRLSLIEQYINTLKSE